MKAIFETDDEKQVYRWVKSMDMALALWHIDQLLTKEKVNYKMEIFHILKDYNINFEDLTE